MYKRLVDEVASMFYYDWDDFVVSFLRDKPPILLKNVLMDIAYGDNVDNVSPKLVHEGGHDYLIFTAIKVVKVSDDPNYYYQAEIDKTVERKICVDGFLSIDRLSDYWDFVIEEEDEDYEYEKLSSNCNKIPTPLELDEKQPVANNILLLKDNTYPWLYDRETYDRCFGNCED